MTTYEITGSSTSQEISSFSSDDLIQVEILPEVSFDTLKFSRNASGGLIIDFSSIVEAEECLYTFTDYFSAASKINNIDIKKSGGGYNSYTISSDALISVPDTDNFVGTDFNEKVQLIVNGENSSSANGGGGNDEIHGTTGNDTIHGGAGVDIIYGGVSGEDKLYGDAGNDTIYGGELDNNEVKYNNDGVEIYGGAGEDVIRAGGTGTKAVNYIQAGEDNDEIYLYNSAKNTLVFTEANFGNDVVSGAKKKDNLVFDCRFTDLTFSQSNNDLIIKKDDYNSVTIQGYFNGLGEKINELYALDSTDTQKLYKLDEDAKIEISGVSDYIGTLIGEKITMVADTTSNIHKDGHNLPLSYNEEDGTYMSNITDGKWIHIDSYADGAGGYDIIYGTSENDYLYGGSGNDLIYGGSSGYDYIDGGDDDDTIYAADTDSNYNTLGTEISGGAGKDEIYIGGNAETVNLINAGADDDIIHLSGGNNLLVFTDQFGEDIVYGATSSDTLVFARDYSGYKFSELSFSRDNNDLKIAVNNNNNNNVVTIANFFNNESPVNKIKAYDEDGVEQEYSIDDALISVNVTGNYEGTKYNEEISMSAAGTVNGNLGNDIVYGSIVDDTIHGGVGDDILYGGQGENKLYGDDGDDILISGDLADDGEEVTYKKDGEEQTVKVIFNAYGDEVYGNDGDDQIFVGQKASVYAGKGNDEITSYDSSNILYFIEDDFGEDVILHSTSTDAIRFTTDGTDGYSKAELNIYQVTQQDGTTDMVIIAQHENKPENKVIIKNYTESSVDAYYTKDSDEPYSLQEEFPIERIDEYDVSTKNVIKGTDKHDLIIADHTKWAGKSKTVYGYEGNDVIVAGKGNDKLYGGEGKNTFNFYIGDGKDTIYANDGSTTIEDTLNIYGVEKDLEKVSLSVKGNDLIVTYSSKDSITIKNYYKQDSNGNYVRSVNKISFFSGIEGNWTEVKTIDELAYYLYNAENTIVDIEELGKSSYKGSIIAETIVGDENNNTLKGGGGNDVIYASAGTNKIYTESRAGDTATVYAGYGKDTLTVGKGTDIYVFEDGHCGDTIVANTTGTLILDLSKLSDVSYTEKGNNLIIINTYALNSAKTLFATETITIKDYLKNKVTNNVFIGTSDADKQQLDVYLKEQQAIDPSTVVIGNPGTSKKQSVTGSFLDETLLGGKGNDTIKSNGGIDILSGGKGNDNLYGYIAKDNNKQYIYDDPYNAKTYGFTYGYDSTGTATIIEGDGKDTIYNSKKSDSIKILIDANGEDLSAVTKFLDDLRFEKVKNNLVITYTDVNDSKGKPIDTITISNYSKLNASDAIKYVYIYNDKGDEIGHIDLSLDVDYTNKVVKEETKIKIIDNLQTIYVIDDSYDDSESIVNNNDEDNVYHVQKSADRQTKIFDNHGGDTYKCSNMSQSLYINDTAGSDTLNITDIDGEVKVFFNAAKTGYTGEIVSKNSLFLVDSEHISITGATPSIEIDNWFDDSVYETMDVYADNNKLSFNLDSVRSAVVSWLDETTYNTSYDALQNAGTDDSVQELINIYTAYNPY